MVPKAGSKFVSCQTTQHQPVLCLAILPLWDHRVHRNLGAVNNELLQLILLLAHRKINTVHGHILLTVKAGYPHSTASEHASPSLYPRGNQRRDRLYLGASAELSKQHSPPSLI